MTEPLRGASGQLPSEVISRLASDLYKMGRAGRRNLQTRMATLAGPVLADAQSRASWSSRIPGAISVRAVTDTTRGRVGVQLRVSVAAAPHARAYEGLANSRSRADFFRHPLFGDRDHWYSQKTRPYALPAVQAKGDDVGKALLDAFEAAAREAGFR